MLGDARQVIRVIDWAKHFECSQSRALRKMAWVPIRVNLAGDGYCQLLDHPAGAAHFGAWIALIELAALCEPRGTLLRGNGKPHDVGTISLVTRIPAEVLGEAIPRLLEIGWIEHVTLPERCAVAVLQDAAGILQDAADTQRKFVATDNTDRTDTTGQDTEANRDGDSHWDTEAAFDQLWVAYPAKGRVKRPLSQQYFTDKIRTRETFDAVLAAARGKWARSKLWADGFVMGLPEWLNQERWNEDPEQAEERKVISTMDPETRRILEGWRPNATQVG